jgi:hypothetical protein
MDGFFIAQLEKINWFCSVFLTPQKGNNKVQGILKRKIFSYSDKKKREYRLIFYNKINRGQSELCFRCAKTFQWTGKHFEKPPEESNPKFTVQSKWKILLFASVYGALIIYTQKAIHNFVDKIFDFCIISLILETCFVVKVKWCKWIRSFLCVNVRERKK